MAECEKYRELLSAYIDNEISEEEKTELFAHVAACPECAVLLKEYEEIFRLLRGDEEPPKELVGNVMAEIRRINAEKTAYRRRFVLTRILPIAAGFAIVMFAAHILSPGFGNYERFSESPASAPKMETQDAGAADGDTNYAMSATVKEEEECRPESAGDIQGPSETEESPASEDDMIINEPGDATSAAHERSDCRAELTVYGLEDVFLSGEFPESAKLPDGIADTKFKDNGDGSYGAYVPYEWLVQIKAFAERCGTSSCVIEYGGDSELLLITLLP